MRHQGKSASNSGFGRLLFASGVLLLSGLAIIGFTRTTSPGEAPIVAMHVPPVAEDPGIQIDPVSGESRRPVRGLAPAQPKRPLLSTGDLDRPFT